jgi:hypothetical protein
MKPSLLRLGAVHAAGNLVLLWLGYYWLGLAESRASSLAWSAAVALCILVLAAVLHGAAFVCFSEPKLPLRRAFATAARRLPLLIVCAIVVIALYAVIGRLHDLSRTPSLQLASYLTLKVRRPIRPATIARIADAIFFVAQWAVVPVLVLPLIARRSGVRTWRYWIATPCLLLCAFWLPLRVLGWVPRVDSFWLQLVSFAVRAAVAYFLFVGAWLATVFLTSAGMPRFTQSKAAGSP